MAFDGRAVLWSHLSLPLPHPTPQFTPTSSSKSIYNELEAEKVLAQDPPPGSLTSTGDLKTWWTGRQGWALSPPTWGTECDQDTSGQSRWGRSISTLWV